MKRIKCISVLVFLSFLQGCGTFVSPSEKEPFVAQEMTKRLVGSVMTVDVRVVDDASQFCSTLMSVANTGVRYEKVAACSVFSKKTATCIVFVGPNAPSFVVGHELRHCFEGDFHS